MKWIEERAQFQKRFDDLSQENVQALITELNKATGNYIARGGISQDPNNNPDYNTIVKLTQRAENIKQRYASLNDDILLVLLFFFLDCDVICVIGAVTGAVGAVRGAVTGVATGSKGAEAGARAASERYEKLKEVPPFR